MPKATAVFDADDSRLGAAFVCINQRMLALQERVAKFAGAWVAVQSVLHLVAAGFEHLREAFEVGDRNERPTPARPSSIPHYSPPPPRPAAPSSVVATPKAQHDPKPTRSQSGRPRR